MNFLPAVQGLPACRPTGFVAHGAGLAPGMASSLAKPGFERTRQTYASRAPSAAGGFRSDPEAHLLCRNPKPAVPAGPKPGAALHHLVTTGSVKKALTRSGWIDHRRSTTSPAELSTGHDRKVRHPAHTGSKCRPPTGYSIAPKASRANSDRNHFGNLPSPLSCPV